ncbi:hypothetical protein I7I53_10893 [Histoplasma capsulatum var. duboisii H88]|uniref:Uncharacterized protein n=1 Tax=Ajellomyces capsulatus (strain H88) TaxID=544711 RepID=A0A8A1LBQ1_AJEC8|nr:hypothetical protein I7I53_10893 [Histoplasma capsulatum var. duboisii H88]
MEDAKEEKKRGETLVLSQKRKREKEKERNGEKMPLCFEMYRLFYAGNPISVRWHHFRKLRRRRETMLSYRTSLKANRNAAVRTL